MNFKHHERADHLLFIYGALFLQVEWTADAWLVLRNEAQSR